MVIREKEGYRLLRVFTVDPILVSLRRRERRVFLRNEIYMEIGMVVVLTKQWPRGDGAKATARLNGKMYAMMQQPDQRTFSGGARGKKSKDLCFAVDAIFVSLKRGGRGGFLTEREI